MLLVAVSQGGEIPYDTNQDGWLIVEVGPGPRGFGATIEARGELDEAIHRALGEALGRLGATIVETWDPLAPDVEEDQVING